MMAIGKPGEMPRAWFEGPDWLLQQQLRPGEVSSLVAAIDENGMPVPAPIPAPAAAAA